MVALLGNGDRLKQPREQGRKNAERSPYGRGTGRAWPNRDINALVNAAKTAEPAWKTLDARGRVSSSQPQRHDQHRLHLQQPFRPLAG